MSPFSQPPAPPPSQPLPEKPDGSRSALSEPPKSALQSLLRAESERPRSGTASQGSSPTKGDHGEIANLVTALRTAQKQIESQSQEVESLKNQLQEESTVRQIAEVQVKLLLEQQSATPNPLQKLATYNSDQAATSVDSVASDDSITSTDSNTSEPGPRSLPHDSNSLSSTATSSTSNLITPSSSTDSLKTTTEIDASTSALQSRLEAFTREMDEMKQQMERYRQRAENAESERSSLLQMIEKLRAKNDAGDDLTEKKKKGGHGEKERSAANGFKHSSTVQASGTSAIENILETKSIDEQNEQNASHAHVATNGKAPQYKDLIANGSRDEDAKSDLANLTQTPSRNTDEATAQEIRDAMATIMKNPEKFRNQRDLMGQAGPYASMLGVVLIGVGLMTWLNGWQKGD